MSRRTAMNPPTAGPVAAPQLASQLANTLTDALVSGEAALRSLAGVAPRDHRDRAASLLTIYDLHMAPLETVRAVARWQGHPAVADIKTRLEGQWLAELEASYAAADIPAAGLDTVDGAAAAIRAIAAKDRLPTAYRWLANEATWPEVVNFLALEGGPDGGFDDLIALCQVASLASQRYAVGNRSFAAIARMAATAPSTVSRPASGMSAAAYDASSSASHWPSSRVLMSATAGWPCQRATVACPIGSGYRTH